MAIYRKKTFIHELQPGMYVAQLDCQWEDTPFALQGFFVNSIKEIRELAEYCKYVFIDVSKAQVHEYEKHATLFSNSSNKIPSRLVPKLVINNKQTYKVTKEFKKELGQAKLIKKDLMESIESLGKAIKEGGRADIKTTRKFAVRVVKSVLRNPDAMIWVSQLKSGSENVYRHSMNCTIWAVALGRHLGMPENELEDIATASLLAKIGMVRIPKELANPENRKTEADIKKYKSYVGWSVTFLKKTNIDAKIINAVGTHQERHDGSGFPNALIGKQIPLYGRIVGLVDTYCEMIDPIDGGSPLTIQQSFKALYGVRNLDFQSELIEALIKTVGVYPPGTVVELNTGDIGVVTSVQNQNRLKPHLIMVMNKNKKRLADYKSLNLMDERITRKGLDLSIARTIPASKFNIDLQSLHAEKKSLFGR